MSDVPTRWLRVRELFDLALDQPTDARAAFVAAAAGPDDSLGREVMSLLGALDHARETLEGSAGAAFGASLRGPADAGSMVGRRAGSYHITRLIGFGGMGAVYEGARADGDFAQRVAIKFLRAGLESDLAIRRFRYERRILATLNHRNIAGLFDGGVTPDGQPFFVMEYVEGEPITAYCDRRRLDTRARVSLFRQVCSAVQHAHQQLIVHRDLKPGNVLVTGDGTVKLLDFGIAKLLREEEGPDQLPLTRGGVRAFTPEYASPEQVRGLPIAAASDVYSLGTILFELVAGRRPFALEGKLLAEIEQLICETPPPRAAAAAGALDTGRGGQIDGDLETILATTLAKAPERRYQTADHLGADLRAWLDGRPIAARKSSLAYRMRKFVARHRIEVAAGALAVAALVVGTVSTARQARVADRERLKTEQVNAFISTMLSAVDPGNRGRDVTVAEVLEQAANDVGKERLEPDVEAQIRHTIGQTYYGLGLYDEAKPHVERAFDLRRGVFGNHDARTAISMTYVVALAEARGAYAQAESLARANVTMFRAMERVDTAELATSLDNLARMIEHQGRLDEAMGVKRESMRLRRGSADSATLAGLTYGLNNLAVSHLYRGEPAVAESLLREAVSVETRLHGPASSNLGDLLNTLGGTLEDLGRIAEADSVTERAVNLLGKALGEEHALYLRALNNHARLRLVTGRHREAVAMAERVVAKIGTALPEGDQTASAALQFYAGALDSVGRTADAEQALQRSLALRKKYLPADHWAIASSEAVLGAHFVHVARYAEGERLLLRGYEKLVASRGADATVTKAVARRIALLYERTRRTSEAAKWRARAG